MNEDRPGNRWVWLYQDEAAKLTFGTPYQKVPAEAHPIVIGAFRFPKTGGMVLQVRSFARALAAARFFGPLFGPRVVLRRVRLLNRWFEADAAKLGLEKLDSYLDRNVTIIDARVVEARLKTLLSGDPMSSQSQLLDDDLPEVEDLPLAPEEETADFSHLGMILGIRNMLRQQHWNGNTHVRLPDIFRQLVQEVKSEQVSG